LEFIAKENRSIVVGEKGGWHVWSRMRNVCVVLN